MFKYINNIVQKEYNPEATVDILFGVMQHFVEQKAKYLSVRRRLAYMRKAWTGELICLCCSVCGHPTLPRRV